MPFELKPFCFNQDAKSKTVQERGARAQCARAPRALGRVSAFRAA
jgi:hypothetical protein